MSVVTNKYDVCLRNHINKQPCLVCGNLVRYPFLEWDNIQICGPCCQRIKQGFTADLIHVAAIMDLHDIGYPHFTLTREPVSRVRNRRRESRDPYPIAVVKP